ncbi:hypothetical protein HPB50_009227 [Hyalomma asiaticum]|uniref:Uncharacterized protein n=1 Tax=Hyalomma asiaticum TaxID=266040 RepID=A0ACB7T696_HYAAI|nr:hypothetical protein HPB50_009227 [Hyalomma asiaticum]
MEKIKSLTDTQVLNLAKEAGFPENYCMLLAECLAAAKVPAKQGRRYTDDWLLLCLLLNIRTPSGYRFLREHNILPLPCVKTIRKYISNVGMRCGFNEDFFVALKDKVEPKSNFQKHGILLFDEMQVRERKCVNSKTLTYAGFVDHGEGVNRAKSSATGLANHALVFMFIPFGESYTQPIGVFASRGPTKGTVLSQLVLQAIILLENAGVSAEVWSELAEFPGAINGSTFDEFVSADDDVAIMAQLQDKNYVADVVPPMSQSDSNKEIDDGPLPTSSEVISALALVWRYCVNMEGCGLSCSDSLDNVEACVLSQVAKSLKQKKIQDYFVPK